MIGYWLYKFVIEDRDVGVVDYKLMENAKDVEYPIPSLCFLDPFIEKNFKNFGSSINRTSYKSYLKGEFYNDELAKVDYENVTLNLDDSFLFAEVRLSNASNKRKIQLKHRTIFNGIIYEEDFFKCFAPELNKNDIENVRKIEFYYRKQGIIEDLHSVRGNASKVWISIHYPGQFLLAINKKARHSLQLYNNYSNLVKIASIELLKSRKKRSHDCMENWRWFDEMVLHKHITTIGCRSPYHLPYKDFPLCDNTDDIRRSAYKFEKVRMVYYPKACWRISKLDHFWFKFNSSINSYWSIKVHYPEDVKIVTQSKEVDGHVLIGNIGGYIGLFLGKSKYFY